MSGDKLDQSDVYSLIQTRDELRKTSDPRAERIHAFILTQLPKQETEQVPGLFSGGGRLAPGETLPHAVNRQVLGGVGRGVSTIPKTAYQGAKDIATIPRTPEEVASHPLINPLGYAGQMVRKGYKQESELSDQARAQGSPTFSKIHRALSVVPAVGPWLGQMLEEARSGDVGAPFEFGVGYGTGKSLNYLPAKTVISPKGLAALTERRASNLSAAAESGGGIPKGVLFHEDVSLPMVDDLRSEATRQGVTHRNFAGSGREGYGTFKKLTNGLRQGYDKVYANLRDPVANRQISSASREAASKFAAKLTADAKLIDDLTKGKNLQAVRNIQTKIASAQTIGELDTQRQALNDLSAKYFGSSESQQAQAPILKQGLAEAGNSIRDVLYREMGKQYSPAIPEASLRNLQTRHGAAIQLDNVADNAVHRLSSAASAETAKPGMWQRLSGVGYRATLASPQHAAAGIMEKVMSPSEVKLFNTRMQRVLWNNGPARQISAPVGTVSQPKGLLGRGIDHRPGQPGIPTPPIPGSQGPYDPSGISVTGFTRPDRIAQRMLTGKTQKLLYGKPLVTPLRMEPIESPSGEPKPAWKDTQELTPILTDRYNEGVVEPPPYKPVNLSEPARMVQRSEGKASSVNPKVGDTVKVSGSTWRYDGRKWSRQ
jgi:hypothetical protein